ncbi:hypothetical protein NDU88_001720 [Pleurodeles waltl]|uniref:Uncharacterized protein n=1 Tax=Pleurodeles waltl TaxID=8319 RepID=A0AAV7VB22_PLEWA|nr:hypothetical protein NDU88_001720 [Pleurodeles waltl]
MVKSAELTGRCAKAVLRSEEKSFSKLEDNATIAIVKKNNELSSKRVHSNVNSGLVGKEGKVISPERKGEDVLRCSRIVRVYTGLEHR